MHLRELITGRMAELGIGPAVVVARAAERGCSISVTVISQHTRAVTDRGRTRLPTRETLTALAAGLDLDVRVVALAAAETIGLFPSGSGFAVETTPDGDIVLVFSDCPLPELRERTRAAARSVQLTAERQTD